MGTLLNLQEIRQVSKDLLHRVVGYLPQFMGHFPQFGCVALPAAEGIVTRQSPHRKLATHSSSLSDLT